MKLDEAENVEERGSAPKCTAREAEIEQVKRDLRGIHGFDKCTLPQYRLWA